MRLVLLIFIACLSRAEVTRVDVTERTNDAGYDRIVGKIHFAIDPRLAPNRIIADIDLAPRNAEGKVEFSADLYMLRPHDPTKRNGTALVEIPNRGGKSLGMFDIGDHFLLEQGFTLVWVGWETDVPPKPGLLRIDAPIATNHGQPITGLVRSEWEGTQRVTIIPLGDRDEIGYPVADARDLANKIFVRDTVEGERRLIPREQWTFADPTHVSMPAGFEPGKIYEVVYNAKDPVLVGLGPAAVRDTVSYLKYGGLDTSIDDFPQRYPARARHRLLAKRQVPSHFSVRRLQPGRKESPCFRRCVGDIAGAGRGGFNARFAQPSRDGNPFFNIFYPVDVPPFSDQGGLLANAIRTNTVPKIFYTNGSYEYWGRVASLIHTTPDGKQDLPPAKDTRIYFFPGSRHGAGSLPPRHPEAQNLDSPNDYSASLRALLIAMQAWLKDGKQPPASVYPLIAKDQLVAVEAYAFPKIPGIATPHYNRRAFRLDFSIEPPKIGPPFPTLVPQVNLDGNETSGIHMPEIQVPLASYTGWNLRSAKIGAPDQLYTQAGSWIPFAVTKAEREKRNDPRLSIEERYPTKQDYLEKITAAAQQLVQQGYLLDRDIPYLRDRAAQEWDYALSTHN